jgi:hypothetical protein
MKAFRYVWKRGEPGFREVDQVEVPDGFVSELTIERKRIYGKNRLPVERQAVSAEFRTIDGCHSAQSVTVFAFGLDRSKWENP